MRVDHIKYSALAEGLARERAAHAPHYEFGALYTLFFVGDELLHASSADGDCLVSVSVSRDDKLRHAVAFAPFGADLPAFFAELVKLMEVQGIRLDTLRHVPIERSVTVAEQVSAVADLVCGPNTPVEFEDRFPQIEWDLRAVLPEAVLPRDLPQSFPSAEFSNWRYQARRFVRGNGEPIVRDYDIDTDFAAACAFAERIAGEMDDHGAHKGDRAIAPVVRFLERLRLARAEHFGRVMEVAGKMVGLSVGGAVTGDMAALYVHLADHNLRGGAQFCFLEAMHTARALGFERLCVGGSETESLLRFKAWNFGHAFHRYATKRELCEIDTVADPAKNCGHHAGQAEDRTEASRSHARSHRAMRGTNDFLSREFA
ncbi:hypothetical protein [Sphingomonas sp.]|uniref:hypothetical protein n=1 Tax=Sphingomonas sp. TaxID=28214 RepID=UPI001B2B1802|nr:hypothetical protein [Sphingomonas sp.]MBO9712490.1 hypothetical protein [Sphingomonas sp.]